MSAIGRMWGINPVLLGASIVVVFGAAWTAWGEWTAAAQDTEQADLDDWENQP